MPRTIRVITKVGNNHIKFRCHGIGFSRLTKLDPESGLAGQLFIDSETRISQANRTEVYTNDENDRAPYQEHEVSKIKVDYSI